MPKCFKFKGKALNSEGKETGSHEFRCYVASKQCTALTTRTHRRCQNNTIMGLPYCHAHSLSILNLLIKKSNTPGHDGKGVFAFNNFAEQGRVFEEGEFICELTHNAQIRTRQQIERRYGSIYNVPYGIRVSPNYFLDGACLRGIGMMINHAPASRANVKIHFDVQDQTISLVALKNINHGTELLMNWNVLNLRGWRPPRQQDHRTYDCKFSHTWDAKYENR